MTDQPRFVPCAACKSMSYHVRHDPKSGQVSVVCAACTATLFSAQAQLAKAQQRRGMAPI